MILFNDFNRDGAEIIEVIWYVKITNYQKTLIVGLLECEKLIEKEKYYFVNGSEIMGWFLCFV